jgi:hypothetical protein
MTERIGSPENPPDARDGTAARGQVKPEGQAGPKRQAGHDAPDSLRPRDADALKSAVRPPHHDRASEEDKPGRLERTVAFVKDRTSAFVKDVAAPVAVTAIIGIGTVAPHDQPHRDPAEGRRDPSEQTAKADGGSATGEKAGTRPVLADQASRPPETDRVVVETSAPYPTPDNGIPLDRELYEWEEKYGDNVEHAVAEVLEKRKQEPETGNASQQDAF